MQTRPSQKVLPTSIQARKYQLHAAVVPTGPCQGLSAFLCLWPLSSLNYIYPGGGFPAGWSVILLYVGGEAMYIWLKVEAKVI